VLRREALDEREDQMGDKSPKAKDKAKMQDTKQKDQKKTDARNKASSTAPKKKA
jgi:hypothetical protein